LASAGHSRRGQACLLAAALLLAGGASPADDSVPEAFDGKETSQWFETVRSGQTVRVVNPFGRVYARFGGYEERAEILATSQRLEAELPELEVRFAHGDEGLDISVCFAADAGETTETRDRVDLVVFVPQGVRLDARTREDLIDVKKLKGDVIASSLGGDLIVHSVAGRVSAKTARGSITATLATGATTEPQDLTTQTGDIEVWLWEDADLSVSLATSGEISTDFTLEVEHHRFEEPSKLATAVVGAGGPELTLRSKQGRVRLLRLQRSSKPGA
jgi:hypothetical protein